MPPKTPTDVNSALDLLARSFRDPAASDPGHHGLPGHPECLHDARLSLAGHHGSGHQEEFLGRRVRYSDLRTR